MAVKSKKKKPVLGKTNLSKNLKNLKEKKVLLALLILLLLLILGAIKLTQPKYSDPKGPSEHNSAEGTVVLEDGTVVSTDSAAATATEAKKAEDKKKAATAAAGGSSSSASSGTGSSGSSPSAPAAVVFDIEPPYGEVGPTYACGPGSHAFNFTVSITANTAGSITYRWVFSDGASIPGSYTFTGAGTHQFNTSWTLGQQNYDGWAKLEVLAPVETSSKASDASFTLADTCAP